MGERNLEQFKEKVEEITKKEQAADKYTIEKARIDEDNLAFLIGSASPDLITEEDFPNVDPLKLIRYRCFAEDNVIGSLQELSARSDSKEAQEILRGHIAAAIARKDFRLEKDLKKIARPEDISEVINIIGQTFFRMQPDVAAAFQIAIQFGLYEEINGRNIPALRALSEKALNSLKLRAISNRIDIVEDELKKNRDRVGYDSKTPRNKEIIANLKEEIRSLQELQLSLQRSQLNNSST